MVGVLSGEGNGKPLVFLSAESPRDGEPEWAHCLLRLRTG